MQEGQLPLRRQRVVRRTGDAKLGTRCEIKNLNSFRFLQEAIEFEVRRQIELIEDGGASCRKRGSTTRTAARRARCAARKTRRTTAISRTRTCRRSRSTPRGSSACAPSCPSCRSMKRARSSRFALSLVDATSPSRSARSRNRFEATRGTPAASPRLVATWHLGDVAAALNRADLDIARRRFGAGRLARRSARIADGTISGKIAKEVFDAMWAGENEGNADAIIAARGLTQISDEARSGRSSTNVISANPAIVAEFPPPQGKGLQPRSSARRWPPRRARPTGAGQRPPETQARRLKAALSSRGPRAFHRRSTGMAKQDTFTSDEWTLIRLAPSLISSGVAAPTPRGFSLR
jgi:aspartyl-tRNA(Asn)/glutamyl-tRNA(Gln) amidotransferase subunit B